MTNEDMIYSDLQEKDADEVVKFMAEHFYPREPLVRFVLFNPLS